MAFEVKFNVSKATNIKQYEYSQSALNHNATQGSLNPTSQETNYGEVENFDYENYLVENTTPQEVAPTQQVVITEEMIEEVRNELRGYGFIDTDIERLLKGEIALEDLYKEIENDPDGSRRRKIYESNYLMSLGSEFNDVAALQADIEKTKRELQAAREAQGAFDFTEEEAAYGLLMALAMYGGDIDEIADSYIIGWSYEDENGVTRYEYSYNPNYYGGFCGATPIYYNDVYKDSKYLEEIKASLVETTRTRGILWWTEEYTAYEWQGTEEQLALYDRLDAAKEKAIADREAKRAEYQTQIDNLTTRQLQEEAILNYVNQELDHYMENVDCYIHQEGFLNKSGMNAALRERASELSDSAGAIQYYTNVGSIPTKYIVGKEDGMAVISAIINNTGDFSCSGGYIVSKKGFVQVSLTDATLKNYSSWLPYMQEEEKQVFNYIYNTEGSEAAYQYLEKIADELDNRWLMDKQQKDAEWAKENPVLASVASVFVTPFEGMNAAFNSLESVITGNEIRRVEVYSAGNTFRQAVSQDIYEKYGEGWAFVYNTGMSMADSIVLIAGCYATGGLMGAAGVTSAAATTTANVVLSATTMGSRAYVSTLNDALDRGLSDGKAVSLAFSSAAVETLMESYSVGHLMNLEGTLGNVTDKIVRKVTSNISNPTLQKIAINSGYFALGAISQGLCEGEEEFCTEIANHYLDEMIAGNLSNYNLTIERYMMEGKGESEARIQATNDYYGQVLMSFLGGFASGCLFGGGKIGVNEFNTSRKVAQAINTEYKVSGLEIDQQTRNNIYASILGTDSRYQDVCIAALTGNLTQEQISTMGIEELFAINNAVNNYQRYDSSVTLENIFQKNNGSQIENNNEIIEESTADYCLPIIKNFFNKLVGKQNVKSYGNIDSRFGFIDSLFLSEQNKNDFFKFITKYEKMSTYPNCSLYETVAMRIIEQSFKMSDQKQTGRQFIRGACFYLINNGFLPLDAANIVSSYAKTLLNNSTSFDSELNPVYGFEMFFSTSIDAATKSALRAKLIDSFEKLPTMLREKIKKVYFYDTYDPGDIYCEFTYNIENMESAASVGKNGIYFWDSEPELYYLAHEAAHVYDREDIASWGISFGTISESFHWKNAMDLDLKLNGKTGVSGYAVDSGSVLEDFADSVAYFVENPSLLDEFPNRKQVLLKYFKITNLPQLLKEMSDIQYLLLDKYGRFGDVLVDYYLHGAVLDSEVEAVLSKYTVEEMYIATHYDGLLGPVAEFTSSDYEKSISQAIDELVNKYGFKQTKKIITEYLNTGISNVLPVEAGIRYGITKFGVDGVRNCVKNLSNGNLDVNTLFSKYYDEITVIQDMIKNRYGESVFGQVIYEHFIYGAKLDSDIAAYVDKYTAEDFSDILGFKQLQDTTTTYTLNHYKKSFEIVMDTLIQKYGLAHAVQIFEEYLKTGNKSNLPLDNNVRFEISKFTIANLNSYLQGMYNGKSIQAIFYEYQLSKDMEDVKNKIIQTYGSSTNIQLVLYNYYVHGANLDSSITKTLSKYTADELSIAFGTSFTDSFSEYTAADYESALSLALNTLVDKYGFKDALKTMIDYFNTGDISKLTLDNNVRFEIGKFDWVKLRNYANSINMTLFYLQNIDINKIDTSILDLSLLTTSQIKTYLGNIYNPVTLTDSSNFINFKDLASLLTFFGDVPFNIRNRVLQNIESSSPKTFLEFRETLTVEEQQQFDEYLNNTIEGRWLATLTSEEIYAINLYTRGDAEEINFELRKKRVSKFLKIISQIDSALAKFSLSEDTILWRGVDYNAFAHLSISNYLELQALAGQEYSDFGYMSTSPAYECSFHKDIMFKIKAPAGTRGAYINQLSSYYNQENEFLLGRGQILAIESVYKQVIDGREKIIIEATIKDSVAQDLNKMTAVYSATKNPLSEYDQAKLFGYPLTGHEISVSVGKLVDVFNELNIPEPTIPLNVLNAIALNSDILTDVLNEKITISGYNQQELKQAVKYYVTSYLKLMEKNGIYDYELITSILESDMYKVITEPFMNQMIEKTYELTPDDAYEALEALNRYIKTLDGDSKYYYLLQLSGLNLDSDAKTQVLEYQLYEEDVLEAVYNHAYEELRQSMFNTFHITDQNVIESLLTALLGSREAFVIDSENNGVYNSEINWPHFVELLSPYIKEKLAVYDPSKPPVLWSKVDCSKLNTKYTTIENSTIGEGMYFLDIVFSNWNNDKNSTPKLETLWSLLSEEFARDLCQMKVSESSSQMIDGLRFIFPGVENLGGPFGDIFKNVEFIEILKNPNIKTITLDAVLSDDVFTSKYSPVTIELDYFRQLIANSNSSYAYEVAFKEFQGIVAAKFLTENFNYFSTTDTITNLISNIMLGTDKIAYEAFKNHLTEDILKVLF